MGEFGALIVPIRSVPSSSVFACLIVLGIGTLPSCSGKSTTPRGSERGGEGGEAGNPSGSGGSGNHGGSANAGRGGSGGASAGSAAVGGASAAGGNGEAGENPGSGGADAGEGGSGAQGNGGAGEGGETGSTAGSSGATGATGGTTGGGGAGAGGAGAGGATGEEAGAAGDNAGGASSCDASDDAPVVLSETKQAFGLALDDDSVYFTSRALDGSVHRVSKQGGATATLSDGDVFPTEIAVSGERVFWAVAGTGTGVARLIEGSTAGGVREVLFDEDEHGIFSLLSDDESLYLTTFYNVLKRVPLASQAATELAGGPFNSFVVDVSLSNGDLFWTNDGVGHFVPTEPESAGILQRGTGGAAEANVLVSRLDFPLFQITADESFVYFNDEDTLYRVDRLGGVPEALVSLPPAPRRSSPVVDLATDGEFVFFADRNAVYRVPATGGTPETIAEGYGAVERLLIDEDHVYFSDNEQGLVVRAGKCATSTGTRSVTTPEPSLPASSAAEPTCTGEPGPHGCPEPTVIDTIANPWGIAVDVEYVYYSSFSTSGSVRRRPLAGGDVLVVASGEVGPHDLTLTDDEVLWCLADTWDGHLVAAPKEGGTRRPLATGVASGVRYVTTDGTFAYYATGFSGLRRVALAGGPSAVVVAGPYDSNAVDLAHYGGELFWLNDGIWTDSTYTAKTPGSAFVAKAHPAGSTVLTGFTLDSQLDYPLYRLTVDENAVYYLDDSVMYRVSRSGGEVTELGSIAPAAGAIVDLETDGRHLYFADVGSVYRMPVTGGDVVTLTSGWVELKSLALSADSVYFTDLAGGAVLRMPK